jgi:bifunctional UDP-N-acetylglucosamine pyrophosphorylase/glucosamine-1-phosphate N-acetyltransferase
MTIDVIILAAGKGTRMQSGLLKVMHLLAGKPLLGHVIDTANKLENAKIIVVHGSEAQPVKDAFLDHSVHWAEQREQQGTAHAVAQALPQLRNNSKALILYGDVPLIELATLNALVDQVSEDGLALLTAKLADPSGYGRVIRDEYNVVRAIVEQKDANPEQLQIKEINTGVICVSSNTLKTLIPKVDRANAQKEYYLTDIIAIASAEGHKIITGQPASLNEVQGVNTRAQLARLERHYQSSLATSLMNAGVGFADPQRFDCRGQLTCGQDVFIDINCVFEGRVSLGRGVRIGPNCAISNTEIGDQTVIKANTVIEGSSSKGLVKIGHGAQIGPFARLREGTTLANDVKIGNFVETKKARLGDGSKASHLSYLGDADIGAEVNIGAGTITCNYDGINKHQTTIGDGAFIGSNSALIAPVSIGDGATIGAGSTISKAVPSDNLSIERSTQRNIKGWARSEKKES